MNLQPHQHTNFITLEGTAENLTSSSVFAENILMNPALLINNKQDFFMPHRLGYVNLNKNYNTASMGKVVSWLGDVDGRTGDVDASSGDKNKGKIYIAASSGDVAARCGDVNLTAVGHHFPDILINQAINNQFLNN
jgi:hypothetical protein